MLFELCTCCGTFGECLKVGDDYVCPKCRGKKPKGILPDKLLDVVEKENKKTHLIILKEREFEEKHTKIDTVRRISRQEQKDIAYQHSKNAYRNISDEINEYFLQHPNKLITVEELSYNLNFHKAGITYALFFLKKDKEIYSRFVNNFYTKDRYCVYSLNKKLIETWLDCELQKAIMDLLEVADKPLNNKYLSEKLETSPTTISTYIKKYLLRSVYVYKVGNEKFYVLKTKNDIIKNVLKLYPTAKSYAHNES